MIRETGVYGELLKGSNFDTANYYALNFNDFMGAFVLLYVLLIVNNWMIIASGILIVTGRKSSQIFFVAFFIITNCVVMNILISTFLDVYSTVHDELENEGREAKRLSIRNS